MIIALVRSTLHIAVSPMCKVPIGIIMTIEYSEPILKRGLVIHVYRVDFRDRGILFFGGGRPGPG
jgi:hypothetical protein